MSLGLGLALLVTVIEVDGNLRRQFIAALPEQAPSFFFLDIQSADAERFDAFIREHAPGATLERVPMMRGRIVSANGVRAEDIRVPASQNWVLQSDRGITYSDTIPPGSRVAEGAWWPPRLFRAAAGLVRAPRGDRARPQDRRHHHGQRTRTQHRGARRQSAHARLAEPRHQLRDGVRAREPARRAAHLHRHADLSRRQHGRAGDRLAEGRRRHLPGDHHGAGARGGRLRRRPDHQPGGWRCAAPARSRC